MERTEITVHKPALVAGAGGHYFWVATFAILLRATVIWAGFAILAPWLGITWYAVLIGLIMLNHLRANNESLIATANAVYLANKPALAGKNTAETTKTDSEMLVRRVNSLDVR